MDLSRERIDKRVFCASFGVREFRRFDGERLRAHALVRGAFFKTATSVSFPWLAIADVERLLTLRETSSQTEIVRAWRGWLHG